MLASKIYKFVLGLSYTLLLVFGDLGIPLYFDQICWKLSTYNGDSAFNA